MAQAVAARMKGDDYQALVFWKYAVKMLSDDSEIAYIEFENGEINLKKYVKNMILSLLMILLSTMRFRRGSVIMKSPLNTFK